MKRKRKEIKNEDFTKALVDLTQPIVERWEKEGIKHYPSPPAGFIPAYVPPELAWEPMRHWDD